MRLTIICPAQHRDDANNYAMVLGQSEADGLTYGDLKWQDADGNLYAAASLPVSEGFIERATGTLERPEWDEEPYTVNMAGAGRAQAALVFWVYDPAGTAPQAAPDKLTAIAGMDGLEALELMGLTPITVEV